jgi:phospholipid N-methyltransferase
MRAFDNKILAEADKMKTFIYLKNLVTDGYVASVTPTSRFGVDKVCNKIDFSAAKVIVEYGPGTGAFTLPLLRNMGEKSKLIVIERNQNFCRYLKKHLKDPRLLVFHDSAENVLDILKTCNGSKDLQADYIISGIPFSFLPRQTKTDILKNSYSALKKGGKFLAYQNFFQFQFPEILKQPVEGIFHNVRTQYVLPNLPPMMVLEAVK